MTEKINSADAVTRDQFSDVAIKTEFLRTKAAIYITAAALLIGVIFLGVAIHIGDDELKAWASGIISLVVGAAIGFVCGNGSVSNGK